DSNRAVVGLVGRADVLQWRSERPPGDEMLFDRASDRSLIVGYPDEPVSHLADRMVAADVGRLPILDRKTSGLVGLVSRKDLLRIRATAKSAEAQRVAYFVRRSGMPATEREQA